MTVIHKKLTLIAAEFPFPPNHGAKVDIWRRLCAFNRLGVQVQLICWVHEAPRHEDLKRVSETVEDLVLLYYPRSIVQRFMQLLLLVFWPLQLTSRIVSQKVFLEVTRAVAKFWGLSDEERVSPVLWLDGIHGADLAFRLISSWKQHQIVSRFFYRSHNIEYLYHQKLLRSAIGLRKIHAFLCMKGLEILERKILGSVDCFFDISIDDLRFWSDQGLKNGIYLPPLIDGLNVFNAIEKKVCESPSSSRNELSREQTFDFVFLGNLRTDNNVQGLIWLLEEVWPQVRRMLPAATICIAGSNPSSRINACQNEVKGLKLIPNPPEANKIYAQAKVLLNPVYLGSGVSVKSVEMLQFGKPVVTRSQGLNGLSREITRDFIVADDAIEFAKAMVEQLRNPSPSTVTPIEIAAEFGDECLGRALQRGFERRFSN